MPPEQQVEGVSQSSNTSVKKGIVGIVSISVIAALGMYLSQGKKDSLEITTAPEEVPTTPTPVQSSTSEQPSTESSSTYKNGVYAANGTYRSPAGSEDVEITLTVVDDKVSKASFAGKATNPASINWQGQFAKGFEQAVVGKNIDELSLTIVNGSSLTPKGFMDALSKIKTQAKG